MLFVFLFYFVDSIDAKSLNQALEPLGTVYDRLTGLQQMWETVSVMMGGMQRDAKLKRLFTKEPSKSNDKTEERLTKLMKALGQMDAV